MIRNVTFNDALTALGDLIMPRECIVCGRPLALHERHLCIGCLADMPRTYFSNMPHNQLADRFNALIQRDLDATGVLRNIPTPHPCSFTAPRPATG